MAKENFEVPRDVAETNTLHRGKDDILLLVKNPRHSSSVTSRPLALPSGSLAASVRAEARGVSVAHAFSDRNTLAIAFTPLSPFQAVVKLYQPPEPSKLSKPSKLFLTPVVPSGLGENAPGETVSWQSTETELVCSAAGGPFGGRLKIEIKGADNLIQYTGPTLPFEQSLAAGEDLSFKIRYRAAKESGAANDIKVTATFTENETEWEQECLDTATAIRLEFKVNVYAPKNDSDHRHRYGVREKVECLQFPANPTVSWRAGGNGCMRGNEFTCPLESVSNPLTVTCNGSKYVPCMTIVEPSGVEARDASAVVYEVPVGEAGGIGMELPSYALPSDVSFSQIAVEEVPNEGGSASGYFTHSDFKDWWHHNEKTGAGNWLDVDAQNRIGIDYPRLEGKLYRMMENGLLVDDPLYGWRYGELNWENPFGWNEQGTLKGTAEHKRFAVDETQNMVILENGRTGVRKLRNIVTRDVDGTVFLNGVKVR